MRIAGEAPKSTYSSRFRALFPRAPANCRWGGSPSAERDEIQRDAAADQQREPRQAVEKAGRQPPLRLAIV